MKKEKKEEKCCGECCWFYAEDTDGNGFCAEAKDNPWGDFVRCDKACRYVRGGSDNYCFVSKKEMRHHMAVLLKEKRWQKRTCGWCSGEIFFPPEMEDVIKAMEFAYRYMKVFSKL